MRDEKFSKAFGKTGRFVKRFRDAWSDASESSDFCYPDVDIIDDEDELVVIMDLPGVDKDNIKLSIMKDSLEVKAEKEEEEYEEGDYYLSERIFKGYYRKLALPEEILPDETSAK